MPTVTNAKRKRATADTLGSLAGLGYGLTHHPDALDLDSLTPARVAQALRDIAELRTALERLAQQLKERLRVCEGCGKPMGGRVDVRFCGGACRQKAYRARQRDSGG